MNKLTITDITIRQDSVGRYCLNDLHKASGGANRHRPSLWLRHSQTKALIEELNQEKSEARINAPLSGPQSPNSGLDFSPVTSQKDGRYEERGTFIVKELVYAYAMWISPVFRLRVIRAYGALVTGEFVRPNLQHENYWFARRPYWPPIRERVLAGERYKAIALALGISAGRVARAVRRMIEVGILSPVKVAAAQVGPARRSARMLAQGWGM